MQTVAYLERGKTYVLYELDENLRELSSRVVRSDELPKAVVDKCDRYGPYDFREVRMTDANRL